MSQPYLTCPTCQNASALTATYCIRCGTEFAVAGNAPVPAALKPARRPASSGGLGCFGIASALAVLVVLVNVLGTGSSSDPAASPVSPGFAASSAAAPNAASDSGTWHQVAHWRGRGSQNTETFHIPSGNWAIQWDARGDGTFSIHVMGADGHYVDLAANVLGKDRSQSYMHEGGDYYLEISATEPWAVTVQACY